jgi:hypothetical protein
MGDRHTARIIPTQHSINTEKRVFPFFEWLSNQWFQRSREDSISCHKNLRLQARGIFPIFSAMSSAEGPRKKWSKCVCKLTDKWADYRRDWLKQLKSFQFDTNTYVTFLQKSQYNNGLRAGWPRNRGLIPGKGKIFLPSTASRSVLGPTQPYIQWVPRALSPGVTRSGHEAHHSSPFSSEVKNGGAVPPLHYMSN